MNNSALEHSNFAR